MAPDPLDEVADGGHQHILLTACEAGHLRLLLAVSPLYRLLGGDPYMTSALRVTGGGVPKRK